MIKAYCDHCEKEISPVFPAGVRYLFGKREYTGHLCPECMPEIEKIVDGFHTRLGLRSVR